MHVLHTVKKRGWSGETHAIVLLAKGLRARGERVTVAAAPDSESARRARAAGVDVLDVRFEKPRIALPRIADGAKLKEFVREQRVDVVHCHASFDHWVAAATLRRLGCLVVRTKHNRKDVARHFLNRWLYTRATDAVVAVSDAVRDDLRATGFFPQDVPVLRYGLDLEPFDAVDRAEARRRLGWTGRVLLYLGRITERKRVDRVLEAGARLRARFADLTTVIVGGGEEPLVAGLRSRFEGPHARFLGPRDDVAELLAAADLFCCPSRGEAFGLAPLEAMAAGCPVVLTDEAGFREFATDGENALLVGDGAVDGLVGAIGRLLDDGELAQRLAAAGRVTARAFSIDGFVERYRKLYGELLAARAQRRF